MPYMSTEKPELSGYADAVQFPIKSASDGMGSNPSVRAQDNAIFILCSLNGWRHQARLYSPFLARLISKICSFPIEKLL